jgi:hypothetical protein
MFVAASNFGRSKDLRAWNLLPFLGRGFLSRSRADTPQKSAFLFRQEAEQEGAWKEWFDLCS